MRPSSAVHSGPESHTTVLSGGAPRGGLRALVSPQLLTGGLTELAWVGAHALLYPLGTRTEPVRPDGRLRPGEQPGAGRARFAEDRPGALAAVLADGLRPRGRHHVHLSADVASARQVGGRRGRPVVLEVRAADMAAAGHVFLLAPNGVWLTDRVPAAYLQPVD